MNKKAVFVLAIIIGIATGLLGVALSDWIAAPRDTVQVEAKPTVVTLSEETWERLVRIIDARCGDD